MIDDGCFKLFIWYRLYELFREEYLEVIYIDLARVVKLKIRKLDGYFFILKLGESYMGRFV